MNLPKIGCHPGAGKAVRETVGTLKLQICDCTAAADRVQTAKENAARQILELAAAETAEETLAEIHRQEHDLLISQIRMLDARGDRCNVTSGDGNWSTNYWALPAFSCLEC